MSNNDNRNLYPSKAHLDARGNYIHDPDNQLFAEEHKQGKTQPQSIGQKQHPFGKPGYCPQHSKLGCQECND